MLSGTDRYWSFQVSFVPGQKKQQWAMNIAPGFSHYTSGEGNVHSVVHTICSIVNGLGGTVTE
jgi:hypothetical protein